MIVDDDLSSSIHLPFQGKCLLIPRNSNTHIETTIVLSEQSYASTAQNSSTGSTAPKNKKQKKTLYRSKNKKEVAVTITYREHSSLEGSCFEVHLRVSRPYTVCRSDQPPDNVPQISVAHS